MTALHPPIPSSNHPNFDNKSQTSTDNDQTDLHHLSPPDSHNSHNRINSSSKIKSSLCKNFMQKGQCPYGPRCQFAHGPQDLKINRDCNRIYKTKDCFSFSKKGFCCFGDRCNFIHEQHPAQNQQKQKWLIIYSNHRQTLRYNSGQNSRLLNLLQGQKRQDF